MSEYELNRPKIVSTLSRIRVPRYSVAPGLKIHYTYMHACVPVAFVFRQYSKCAVDLPKLRNERWSVCLKIEREYTAPIHRLGRHLSAKKATVAW